MNILLIAQDHLQDHYFGLQNGLIRLGHSTKICFGEDEALYNISLYEYDKVICEGYSLLKLKHLFDKIPVWYVYTDECAKVNNSNSKKFKLIRKTFYKTQSEDTYIGCGYDPDRLVKDYQIRLHETFDALIISSFKPELVKYINKFCNKYKTRIYGEGDWPNVEYFGKIKSYEDKNRLMLSAKYIIVDNEYDYYSAFYLDRRGIKIEKLKLFKEFEEPKNILKDRSYEDICKRILKL